MSNSIEASRTPEQEVRFGTMAGALAYGLWGVLAIYFHALDPASPLEILGHRILWSLLICVVIWSVRRDLSWLRPLLRHPSRLVLVTIAALILSVNWGVFIYAVASDNVVESSLGYFINPLFLVLMGVLILGERMSRAQWIAITLGAIAVLIISIDYGRLPYIALTLASSFAIYGFLKKKVGANLGALESMTIETAVLAPLAVGILVIVDRQGDATFATNGLSHAGLLAMSGIITTVPLVLFAVAASRVPLVTLGMLQFLAPIGQFLIAVYVFHEKVPLARWIGFGFVWAALTILTIDTIRRSRRRQRRRPARS